jgi:hypothetical protein
MNGRIPPLKIEDSAWEDSLFEREPSFLETDPTPAWRDLHDAIYRLQSRMTNIEELRRRAIRADPANRHHSLGEDEFERVPQSFRRLRPRLEEEQAQAAEVGASHPIPTHLQPMRRR